MIYLQKMMSFYHIYVGLQEGKEKNYDEFSEGHWRTYWKYTGYEEDILSKSGK